MDRFDYDAFFDDELGRLHREARYRRFQQLGRELAPGPVAFTTIDGLRRAVTVWCSNDYLGMSRHPLVLEASRLALARYGAGAGGTRNISGTHEPIVALEAELAALHGKEAALVFSSGYVANDTVLATLAARLPGCIVLSDADNHASMIEGMRRSRAEVQVFAHSDPAALDARLSQVDPARPKLVAFESLYSMNGDVAPLRELLAVARRHGALSYVDETHAVGVHGPQGGGLLEAHDLLDQADIVQGGLGKGYGVVGGFVTGRRPLIDFVRSHAPGFIFTTALPPAVAAAALASVRHLRSSQTERLALRRRVEGLRARLQAAALPVLPTTAQILPLLIGDSARCTLLAERLLREHSVYLQPINYPTVPRGAERLRITPSPLHDEAMTDALVEALVAIVPPGSIVQRSADALPAVAATDCAASR
ncbi:MAG: 5-aminolevulinate synthase [Gammaproteobacteria bacterium]|nr:5-aminolevulinate synthase [Gammaproteobacteria bacterium]